MKESKKFVIAPVIPVSEVMTLRAYIDECYDPPDYPVTIDYVCDWSQFGSNFGILGNFPAFKT